MSNESPPFLEHYRGYFKSALRWDDLRLLWQQVENDAAGDWYIYAVGEPPPERPAAPDQVKTFVQEIDALLRRDHDEDYCGIVYADDPQAPGFIKIYDPNNLGSVCGPGLGPPPLPGWILSKERPVDLESAFPLPANRRRWWQRLFG